MPRLTFGYLYDFRNPDQWKRDWHALYEETIALAAWTEEAGFDAAWVPEHHLASDSYVTSPLIALAAIAARTKRIRLGSAISLAPLYHPYRFAEDCVALDAISGGRLEMALAIGYRRREYEAFGSISPSAARGLTNSSKWRRGCGRAKRWTSPGSTSR
jgi:alkanesulfonate monooxygenase SsuD/methylene tetrahydromethanopterin reductase-like flavin-dependent oxidoreductase (luciferase family)